MHIRRIVLPAAGAAGALALAVAPASAHVTISPDTTAAGSYAVLTVSVPHGCDGAATTKIAISMPEEIPQVTATRNPFWDLEVQSEPLAEPIEDAHGNEITEREAVVVYTAKEPLPDPDRDTFELSVQLPDAVDETFAFPIVQTCTRGETSWTEVAEEGQDVEELEHPAPLVTITEPVGRGAGTGAHGVERGRGGRGRQRPRTRRPRHRRRRDRHRRDRAGPEPEGVVAMVRRALAAVLLAGLLVGSAGAPASAHASLVSTDPAEGAVVPEAPDVVTFTFNEPVSLAGDSIQAYDAAGEPVDVDASARDEVVTADLADDLADGTYVVAWRVVSSDGHPIAGSLTFHVGAPSETVVPPRDAPADRRLRHARGGQRRPGAVVPGAAAGRRSHHLPVVDLARRPPSRRCTATPAAAPTRLGRRRGARRCGRGRRVRGVPTRCRSRRALRGGLLRPAADRGRPHGPGPSGHRPRPGSGDGGPRDAVAGG